MFLSDSLSQFSSTDLLCNPGSGRAFSAGNVTRLLILFLIASPLCFAQAQQQERQLAQRLMEPDMKLGNDAQNKKFTADKSSVNKKANVNAFYVQQRQNSKQFSGSRQYSAREFNSRNFEQGDQPVARNISSQKAADWTYSASGKTADTKAARDQNKTQASRNYAGNRPYLEKGKSQKSLSRKNRPMTIDEVRELLNKNK